MNDYMKSLQKHFDRQEHNELDERIRCVREELREVTGQSVGADCSICSTHRTPCWWTPR